LPVYLEGEMNLGWISSLYSGLRNS